jgi:hypothetical protein
MRVARLIKKRRPVLQPTENAPSALQLAGRLHGSIVRARPRYARAVGLDVGSAEGVRGRLLELEALPGVEDADAIVQRLLTRFVRRLGLGAEVGLIAEIARSLAAFRPSKMKVATRNVIIAFVEKYALASEGRAFLSAVLESSSFGVLEEEDQLELFAYALGPELGEAGAEHRAVVETCWSRRRLALREFLAALDQERGLEVESRRARVRDFLHAPVEVIRFERHVALEVTVVVLGAQAAELAIAYTEAPANVHGEYVVESGAPEDLESGEAREVPSSRCELAALAAWIERAYLIVPRSRELEPRAMRVYRRVTSRHFARDVEHMFLMLGR